MSFVIAEFAEWITECDQLWKKTSNMEYCWFMGGSLALRQWLWEHLKKLIFITRHRRKYHWIL